MLMGKPDNQSLLIRRQIKLCLRGESQGCLVLLAES